MKNNFPPLNPSSDIAIVSTVGHHALHASKTHVCTIWGAPPKCLSGKEPACQCRRHGFDPWVRNIRWRRKWQTTSVFLPGKSHGQRSLAGYGP